jgi:hypothetical protein
VRAGYRDGLRGDGDPRGEASTGFHHVGKLPQFSSRRCLHPAKVPLVPIAPALLTSSEYMVVEIPIKCVAAFLNDVGDKALEHSLVDVTYFCFRTSALGVALSRHSSTGARSIT